MSLKLGTTNIPGVRVAGGGGSSVTVEALNISENGTYTAPEGKAYSPVNVNVPSGWDPNDVAEENVPTGDLVLNTATSIGKFAFASRTALTSVSAPNCTEIKEKCFQSCTGLKSVYLPAVTKTETNAFDGCNNSAFTVLALPSATTIGARLIANCSKLVTLDLGNGNFPTQGANGASSLRNIVLRNSSVVSLPSWAGSTLGGVYNHPTESTIYVPSALISSYQTATNWVTGYNAGLTFTAIEGSYYETHYADGTPIGA